MSNLTPEQRLDKNNRLVTRHVKTDKNAGASRLAVNAQDVKRKAPPSFTPDKTKTIDWFSARPTDEDKAEALQNVINGLPYGRRWDKVMGDGTRRTQGNIAEYTERQKNFIESQPALADKLQQESYKVAGWKSHARAFDAGISTEYDDEFEKIWKGESKGYSEDVIKDRLRGFHELETQLTEGFVKPAAIVGTGYINTRKVAEEYISKGISDFQEALRTRGRSLTINISNAIINTKYDN